MSDDPFEALLKEDGQQDPHVKAVKREETSGRYRIGPPVRPPIAHDNGFLDKYPHRESTLADRAKLAKWVATLRGSQALCNSTTGKYVEHCNGEDLSDANAAYEHFLFGNGADRTFDYERYLSQDPAAAHLIDKLINDFRDHAEVLGKNRVRFSLTSTEYSVGMRGFAPYPRTTNWQKALGAHYLWVSADVAVSADQQGIIWYNAQLTMHVEDRYNFNPGSADIATGVPDSENGVFEITGLAKQYTNFAIVHRETEWSRGERIKIESFPMPSQKHKTSRSSEHRSH